jgi:hypothetical protein
MEIEEAIVRLDDGLRRLKVQYEMFFAGSLKRPPYDLRREIEHIIHDFSNTAIRNYAHRFQFNTLVAKYNALYQLWSKQMRAREEGGRAPGAGAAAEPQSAPEAAPATPSSDEDRVYFKVLVADPRTETESMRLLYERYLEARRSGGAGETRLKLERFVDQVAKQADDLKQSLGCASIEFRVLRSGETVSLKARPAPLESKP